MNYYNPIHYASSSPSSSTSGIISAAERRREHEVAKAIEDLLTFHNDSLKGVDPIEDVYTEVIYLERKLAMQNGISKSLLGTMK